MKAVIYDNYGTVDVLELSEVVKPIPKDNEVLIKVHAAEATKSDCEMRSFKFAVSWFWLPLRIALGIKKPKNQILGGYFAGEIESFGENVTNFNIAEQVFGSCQLRMGAYGEYLCLPDSYTIVPLPKNLSYAQSAAVPLGGLNALHFLNKAEVKSGETVLINGAGGSIGTFAVQIAKSMGAEVTAVDIGFKEEMLRKIGADHFIDYTKEMYTDNAKKYDVIFDMVAESSYSASVKSLKSKGRYLLGNPRISCMLRSIFTSKFSDKKIVFVFAQEKISELTQLREMIEQGKISPVVDKVYPMEKVAEAHRKVETEQRLGSVVLSWENSPE
jgi:NADPH:quinone reductase-like Zn-dependent oxidoreductase